MKEPNVKNVRTVTARTLMKALRDADRKSGRGDNRALICRLRDVMDTVVAAQAEGMSNGDIFKTLHESGLGFTQGSFNTSLHLLRKERQAAAAVRHCSASRLEQETGPGTLVGTETVAVASDPAASAVKGVVTYTAGEIAGITRKLQALPAAAKKEKNYSKQDAILMLANDLNALRERGYTTAQLAEALSAAGLTITRHTLNGCLLRAKRLNQGRRPPLTVVGEVGAQAA